ncbi:MAG: hypothetical protein ACOYVD_01710 [Bacillota bacterium]
MDYCSVIFAIIIMSNFVVKNGVILIFTPKFAYILLATGAVVKTYGLYSLAGRKEKDFAARKKQYTLFNWSGNILLFLGVIILAIKWYG